MPPWLDWQFEYYGAAVLRQAHRSVVQVLCVSVIRKSVSVVDKDSEKSTRLFYRATPTATTS